MPALPYALYQNMFAAITPVIAFGASGAFWKGCWIVPQDCADHKRLVDSRTRSIGASNGSRVLLEHSCVLPYCLLDVESRGLAL